MIDEIYNWKRFWVARDGDFNLSDGGYLYDPDSDFGNIYNPDVLPFGTISKFQCLILLGEPGIGKTQTLKSNRNSVENKILEEGNSSIWLDLRSIGSEQRLDSKIFENETFLSWVEGNHELHIYLDSLDECLLQVKTVATILADELQNYPVKRLHLRIACRTADWPASLEKDLEKLWGDQSVGVFEMAPLRRADVQMAASVNDLDSLEFLDEIDHMEAVPLAIKPITLGFLIKSYSRTGKFPSSKTELYRLGCRLLCEEPSEHRRDKKLTGNLTTDQRLAVATRIAAITIFTNKYAIWTDVNLGQNTDADVSIQELCGGFEEVQEDEFEVSEDAIQETLSTGLFSARGQSRLGWAHQTYAEFLAALYLQQRKMALNQIMSLIIHSSDTEHKIVPQLNQTTSWLASLSPDVFKEIIPIEPEILLQSDLTIVCSEYRKILVANLLKLFDENKLVDFDRKYYKHYRKLNHSELADQLQPYIIDKSKGIIVRRVAMQITRDCQLEVLQEELIKIVLDSEEVIHNRINAASAISEIGDHETKLKLKPLLKDGLKEDADDQLKAIVLSGLWPEQLTVQELFEALCRPKDPDFFGRYYIFLTREIPEKFTPSDLSIALSFINKKKLYTYGFSFRIFVDKTILKAFQNIEQEGMLDAFCEVALSKLQTYHEIIDQHDDSIKDFINELQNNDDKRRKILATILSKLKRPENEYDILTSSRTPLVISKDVPWMIEQLKKSDFKRKVAWANVIYMAFDSREPVQRELLLTECQHIKPLAEVFSNFIKPVEIDSPEAKKTKERYLKTKKWQDENSEKPYFKVPLKQQIFEILDKCESGNHEDWVSLKRILEIDPNNPNEHTGFGSNITGLFGWKSSASKTRKRILEAAKSYVFYENPKQELSLLPKTITQSVFAGYAALELLFSENKSALSNLPSEVWRTWLPMLLVYPSYGRENLEDIKENLVTIAYTSVPEEVIKSLMTLIDRENDHHRNIFVIEKIESCWDDSIANALFNKLKDKKLTHESFERILITLLDHNNTKAKKFAISLVRSINQAKSKAKIAACTLIFHTGDATWDDIWKAIVREADFGRDLLSTVAYKYERDAKSFLPKLSETQLADLYPDSVLSSFGLYRYQEFGFHCVLSLFAGF